MLKCAISECKSLVWMRLPCGDKFIHFCFVHFQQWRKCNSSILEKEFSHENR